MKFVNIVEKYTIIIKSNRIMSERKINLESIILEAYGCKDVHDFKKSFDVSIQMVKEICIETCRQVLELAAQNVELSTTQTPPKQSNGCKWTSYWVAADDYDPEYWIVVDKQSILNTINQVK